MRTPPQWPLDGRSGTVGRAAPIGRQHRPPQPGPWEPGAVGSPTATNHQFPDTEVFGKLREGFLGDIVKEFWEHVEDTFHVQETLNTCLMQRLVKLILQTKTTSTNYVSTLFGNIPNTPLCGE